MMMQFSENSFLDKQQRKMNKIKRLIKDFDILNPPEPQMEEDLQRIINDGRNRLNIDIKACWSDYEREA